MKFSLIVILASVIAHSQAVPVLNGLRTITIWENGVPRAVETSGPMKMPTVKPRPTGSASQSASGDKSMVTSAPSTNGTSAVPKSSESAIVQPSASSSQAAQPTEEMTPSGGMSGSGNQEPEQGGQAPSGGFTGSDNQQAPGGGFTGSDDQDPTSGGLTGSDDQEAPSGGLTGSDDQNVEEVLEPEEHSNDSDIQSGDLAGQVDNESGNDGSNNFGDDQSNISEAVPAQESNSGEQPNSAVEQNPQQPGSQKPAKAGMITGSDGKKTPFTIDRKVEDAAELEKVMIETHNKYRKDHGVGPLKWDPSLKKPGFDEYMKSCVFTHKKFGKNGQNIAEGPLSAASVVKNWYDENEQYDYNGGQFSMGTGHFTQIVWKGTTSLFCGVQPCGEKKFYVCEYGPAGNMMGDFKKNVFPKGTPPPS